MNDSSLEKAKRSTEQAENTLSKMLLEGKTESIGRLGNPELGESIKELEKIGLYNQK